MSHWLSLFLGAVSALAFAPFEWRFMILIGLVPLALSWYRQTPRQAWRTGFFFGLGLFGVGAHWIYSSMTYMGFPWLLIIPITLLFIVVMAAFIGLTGWLGAQTLLKRSPVLWFVGFLPLVWLGMELFKGSFLHGFPWLEVGYTTLDTPFVNWAPWLGSYGLGWLVLVLAGLVAILVRSSQSWPWVSVSLAVLIGLSAWVERYHEPVYPDRPLQFAVVQAGVDQADKWQADKLKMIVDRYMEMSQPYLGEVDAILWPETALPTFWDNLDAYMMPFILEAQEKGTHIISGVPVRDESGRYYNSVMDLTTGQRYDKHRLVPFSEYYPLGDVLSVVADWMAIPMSSFSPGSVVQPVFEVKGEKVGVTVCYEIAFSTEVKKALPHASVLFNFSNEAWFKGTYEPAQLLEMARMRAIESGRTVIRANTGYSAYIAPNSRVISSNREFNQKVILFNISNRAK